MKSKKLAFSLSLAALLSLSAAAQTYTAKHVRFKNPGPFTQSQLEAVAGFHAGTTFTTESLTAAAQKLADTGFFDNVGAGTEGPVTNLTAEFLLTPSDPAQFLPVGFDNFVWLTPEEITAAIREKLPLFAGRLPEAGAQLDTVNAALVTALAAKGVQARVTYATVEPSLAHPVRTVDFSVVSPAVVVGNIKLGGVAPELAPLLQKSVNNTARRLYNQGLGGEITADAILAPLREAGYVQSSLAGLTFDPPVVTEGRVPLILHATLSPGEVYHLATLNFAGSDLYSAADFSKTAKLHPGDIANESLLHLSLQPIDDAYRSKGYIDVIVDAKPTFDETAHTVSYTVTVTPGEPYKLNQVTTDGLDPEAKAGFDQYFLIHPGDIYNPVYVTGFIKNNTAISALAPYSGTYRAIAYPATHTVDLQLAFLRRGRRQQSVTVH